jgi:hypothetical protein
MTAPDQHRPRRLDLLAPADTTPDPAVPSTAERLLVIGGLWALPLVNLCLLTTILLLLLWG